MAFDFSNIDIRSLMLEMEDLAQIAGLRNFAKLGSELSISAKTQMLIDSKADLNATADIPVMTSAEFATKISDETGSGLVVFDTTPTLVTPILGVASGTSLSLSSDTTDLALLTLINTNADDTGSSLILKKLSSALTDNDYLGHIKWTGYNDAVSPEEITYGRIYVRSVDVSDGNEDGQMEFRVVVAGTERALLRIAGNNVTIGHGVAGVIHALQFDGEDHDGYLDWMGTLDYFRFEDDLLMYSTEKLMFLDTAIGIYSQANTFMDLFADGAIRIGDSSAGAPTNYANFANNGNLSFVGSSGFYPRRIRQTTIPANGTTDTQIDIGELLMWCDSDDSDKIYLVYNDATKGIVSIALA